MPIYVHSDCLLFFFYVVIARETEQIPFEVQDTRCTLALLGSRFFVFGL